MIGVKNRGAFQDPTVEDEFEWADTRISSIFLVEHNEDGTHRIPDPLLAIVPLGGCIPYTGASGNTPRGWLIADGTAVSRVTYKTYFDLVGITYGAGDGVLTFNMPDMRQKFPLGKAASGTGAVLGATGGTINHIHSFSGGSTGSAGGHGHSVSGSTDSAGSHSHSQGAHSHALNTVASADAAPNSPFGSVAGQTSQTDIFNDSGTGTSGSHSHSVSGSTDSVGDHSHSLGSGSTATANPPFLALNYIVYVGI